MRADLITIRTTETDADISRPPGCGRTACKNTTTFLVGKNSRGQWIARERSGLYGGLFVSRANAVRYALFENGHRPEAVIEIAGNLELDMSTPPPDPESAFANAA